MNELITLTKRYLTEEHSPADWLWADRDTFEFFKRQAEPPPAPKPKPQPQAASPIHRPTPAMPQRRAAPPAEAAPQKEPQPAQKTPPKRTDTQTSGAGRNFTELRTLIKESAPNFKILEAIPSDDEAKRTASAWKDSIPEVAIIAITATKTHLDLLEKIAGAIRGLGYSSKVLIGEQQWERLFSTSHLKLTLAPQETLSSHPEFKGLDSTKVCPLLPIDIYLQKPEEKASLWKQIRSLLS